MSQTSDSASTYSENLSQLSSQETIASSLDDPWESPHNKYLNQAHEDRIASSIVKEESPTIERNRSSFVWNHMPDEDPNTIYLSKKGKVQWHCQHCSRKYIETGGTRVIKQHLQSAHSIIQSTSRQEKRIRVRGSIEKAMESAAQSTVHKRRRQVPKTEDESARKRVKVDPAVLEKLYVRLLAQGGTSLRFVDSDEFKALLTYLNEDIEAWAPSADTANEWIFRSRDEEKQRKKQELKNARSRINIVTDEATSETNLSVLTWVAIYINQAGILVKDTLALREIEGAHNAENLAGMTYVVLKDWGLLPESNEDMMSPYHDNGNGFIDKTIVHRLGYFSMDNIGTNDAMLEKLSLILFDQHDINWDPSHHRIRCQGHVLNLCAQAFMFSTQEDALLQSNNTNASKHPTEGELELWRRKGPVGKAHNNVTKIRASTTRIQNFKKLSGGRLIPKDNSTRWTSWKTTIGTILDPTVCAALLKFYQKYPDVIGPEDQLTKDDFQTLSKIYSVLKILYDATVFQEGDFATLDRVLPSMEFVLAHFEANKIEYAQDPFLSPCINSGWAKLDKYYALTDKSPAYVAAVVLDPAQKWQYFQEQWSETHPEWIPWWKGQIRGFWETEYKPATPSSSPSSSPLSQSSSQSSSNSSSSKRSSKPNAYVEHLEAKRKARLAADEYNLYLSTPPIPQTNNDPRAWWLEDTQQRIYPNLSKMALDILSIPAMSAEAERVFSLMKYILSDKRCAMKIELLEALIQLNSWMKLNKWMETTILVESPICE